MMENKWHLVKVLPMRFYLNGHTKRFYKIYYSFWEAINISE